MPSYAVLGATGNMGSLLVTELAKSPNNEINAYARAEQKLRSLLPKQTAQDNVHIHTGPLSDVSVITNAIRGTRATYLAVAVQTNVPGCSIAQDTAHVVMSALRSLREQHPSEKLPHLVVLSSASVTKKFCTAIPGPIHTMLLTALSYVYGDLMKAEEFLRKEAEELDVNISYFKPGGISNDISRGHRLSESESHTFMSFVDCARGMAELGAGENADGERWHGKDVSVIPPEGGTGAGFAWEAPLVLVKGLLCHFFPVIHHYIG